MSGHNPHGRLGQPNSTWNNHLQVPSYIPRQPQIAHMSNERPSPMSWHTPTPPEALYSFMAANHKNPLEMNPLLPNFVRAPFGSVDLTIPSAARNNSLLNTLGSIPLNPPPPELNLKNNNLNRTSTSPGVIQMIGCAKEKLLIGTNGDIHHIGGSGIFVKDADRINKESVLHETEPVELVKDMITELRNKSPVRSLTTNDISPVKQIASPQSLIELPPPPSSQLQSSPIIPEINSSIKSDISTISTATLTSEDSIDSNISKKRRKRKPNKTQRMSNENEECDGRNNLVVTPISISKKLVDYNVEVRKTTTSPLDDVNTIEVPSEKSPEKPSQILSNNNSSTETVVNNLVLENLNHSNGQQEISLNNSENENNNLTTSNRSTRVESEGDDCETIDKIAAMIASDEPVEVTDNQPNTSLSNISCLDQSLESQLAGDIKEDVIVVKKKVDDEKAENGVPNENSFEEVENKLEEMFAGIEDDRPASIKIDEIPKELIGESLESDKKPELELTNLPKTTKAVKRPIIKNDESCPSPRKKKKQLKKRKQNNKGGKGKNKIGNKFNSSNSNLKEKSKIKEESLNEAISKNYKGPFVQVKADGSLSVVNTPIEDDPEKAQNKFKPKKSLHSHNANERNKIRGLHVSTLSKKYDADTTDVSWKCVFCKMGPHKSGLGDLFGPYFVTTTCDDFQLSQIDPDNDVFKSKRTKQEMKQRYLGALPVAGVSGIVDGSINQKLKHKNSESSDEVIDIFAGMSQAGETSYEVWVHEDCAVFSSGVYFIGVRVVGLEAAVWSSSRHLCTICSKYGAMLSCLQRGCNETAHIPCARNNQWVFNDEDFKSRCEKHSIL